MKADDAVRIIARTPKLKDRAVAVAAEISARSAKADVMEMMAVLIEHTPVYGLGNKTSGEYDALFVAYLRALAPLPIEAIREAFVIWGRDGNGFYPRPEQLFQRAEPYAKELWMAAYRAKRAAEFIDNRPREKTAADRAADRQRAIDAGILDADGKMIPLQFKKNPDARRVGTGETRQQMADRLRRIASGQKPIEPHGEVEEAI